MIQKTAEQNEGVVVIACDFCEEAKQSAVVGKKHICAACAKDLIKALDEVVEKAYAEAHQVPPPSPTKPTSPAQ